MSEIQNMEAASQQEAPTTKLPMSYVMWLTIRSKFIDEYAKTHPEILNLWKEYETQEIDRLIEETEALNVN